MRERTTILVMALLAGGTAAAKGKYTLKDLDALAAKGAWLELAGHIADVKPSSRNREWEGLLQKAAINVLDEVNKESPLAGVMASQELLRQFPQLKKSKEFMVKRVDSGLKGYKICLADSYAPEECIRSLKTFVAQDEGNAELALKAGKVVSQGAFHWVAVPFFAKAAGPLKDKGFCSDDDVHEAVLSGLEQSPSSNGEIVTSSRTLAGSCFPQLKPALLKQLNEAAGYFAENGCAVLKDNGGVPPEAKKPCQGK